MNFIKPKFWDLDKPNFLSRLLIIFTTPIIINNFLLNIRSKKKDDRIKTICIGNIYLGGTGKTPTTIKLFKILKKLKFNVAIGKKFYKSQLDEIFLLEKETYLITGINRRKIIEKAVEAKNDLLIFDDGLQDKSLNYDIKIVCFNLDNLIGNGQLIPAGPLREKLISLKKYDVVFLKGNSNNYDNINKLMKRHNPNIQIFNTTYKAINIDSFNSKKKYLLFSGIGNPKSFKKILLENNINVVEEMIFPDHFEYKKKHIENIRLRADKLKAEIITTEKDYIKISKDDQIDIKFLKINLKIINEENFIDFIITKLND